MKLLKILKFLAFTFLLFANPGLSAQTDYRPSTAKGHDHSYFKGGKINIINSSHQDIAWMDSIGACENGGMKI